MMRARKSMITILFFGALMATWLGLPGLIMDENTRSLQEEDDTSRDLYTFKSVMGEEELDPAIEFKRIIKSILEREVNDPSIENAISNKVSRNAEEKEGEDVDLSIENTNRPVMYTFYEETPGGCCGMTSEGHEKLLYTWSRSWEERGWETKVLNKADAVKHPDFEMLELKLKKLGVGEYDRRCYWRWLAMAAMEGGGWMSDYDLFPLQLTPARGAKIAQDGTFKSFAMHVPCLIHASREEWDRIIHLMIDELPDQRNGTMISDMYSLLNLDRDGDRSEMQWYHQVAPNFIYNTLGSNLYIDCRQGKNLAVHLSHAECDAAVKGGRFPLEVEDMHQAVRERAEAALILMDDFKNHCLDRKM